MTTALVTGAGGSLGRSTALRLAKDGNAVAVLDSNRASLDETYQLLNRSGAQAMAIEADLRSEGEIKAAFEKTKGELGPVGILVNNAAIYPKGNFLEVPIEQYDDVVRVNQRAYYLAAQCAARQMAAARGGAIVNVASITFFGGWPELSAYVSTKGAAVALTRALARELGPLGIRVNAISPGAIPTAAEKIHPDPKAYEQFVLEHQSLKRRGRPEDIAAVVSYLCGKDSAFVTGQNISVDGGWVMI